MKNLILVAVAVTLMASVAQATTIVDLRYSGGRNIGWASYAEAIYLYGNWGVDVVQIECKGYQEWDFGVCRSLYAKHGITLTGEVYLATATGDQNYWVPTAIVSYDMGKWHGAGHVPFLSAAQQQLLLPGLALSRGVSTLQGLRPGSFHRAHSLALRAGCQDRQVRPGSSAAD